MKLYSGAVIAMALMGTFNLVSAETITVITPKEVLKLESAYLEGDDLWVDSSDLKKVNGFEIKAEGVCYGSICIPMPANKGEWVKKKDATSFFNVTAFAKKLKQQFATDDKKTVFSFAPIPDLASRELPSGKAPELILKDRKGKTVKLSDFRGKKVLLWTFASW
jgi:hypothetical protein